MIAEVVPVERIGQGDVLVLPWGGEINVERVDTYGPEIFVRWWRPADRGEPGHKQHGGDGRYLGSLKPLRAGDGVLVRR